MATTFWLVVNCFTDDALKKLHRMVFIVLFARNQSNPTHSKSMGRFTVKKTSFRRMSTSQGFHSLPFLRIRDTEFTLLTIPAPYQIANYNIHPPPTIKTNRLLEANITIYVQVVELPLMSVVVGGFQGGDVRVFRSGQDTIHFTGLKL